MNYWKRRARIRRQAEEMRVSIRNGEISWRDFVKLCAWTGKEPIALMKAFGIERISLEDNEDD